MTKFGKVSLAVSSMARTSLNLNNLIIYLKVLVNLIKLKLGEIQDKNNKNYFFITENRY